MKVNVSQKEMEQRWVSYDALQPCTTAFIDTRTPGSERKENFTVIGAGVAENPDQHVHITIPHGFNIGAARQPPHCVNSQHAHETAEVFMVHSGTWAFRWGIDADDGEVVLHQGDTISIPVEVFRGFENIGNDVGFLYAILGGDDPGKVLWAPYVFDMAKDYGLVLLENGQLVDTQKGETIPSGSQVQKPTTAAEALKHRRMTASEMAQCVCSEAEAKGGYNGGLSIFPGVKETPIIGADNPNENMSQGKMAWRHGFHFRCLEFDSGSQIPAHQRFEEEVIFIHQGQLTLSWEQGKLTLGKGDVLTLPIKLSRSWSNPSSETTVAYVVRGSDNPQAAQFV